MFAEVSLTFAKTVTVPARTLFATLTCLLSVNVPEVNGVACQVGTELFTSREYSSTFWPATVVPVIWTSKIYSSKTLLMPVTTILSIVGGTAEMVKDVSWGVDELPAKSQAVKRNVLVPVKPDGRVFW